MSLRSKLDALASSFADSIVQAIRGASLQELLGAQDGAPRRPGRPRKTELVDGGVGQPAPVSAPAKARATKSSRLKRRSSEDIAAALGDVVALVKKSKDGLRAEEIREKLGLQAKEMPRVLKEGLSTKMLSKKGQKRATVYFAAR